MKNLVRLVLPIMMLSFLSFSCDSDDNPINERSTMSVRLVDAPGDYESVILDVQEVEAIVDDETISLDTKSDSYDLLTLTGGDFASLADEDIPTGSLSQIRLILGSENTLVLNGGESFNLQTPSAQQSGLKLNVNYNLEPGVLYEFILDFKVDESIVAQGISGYLLKPVIRVSTVAESGSISGKVTPIETQSKITAINDTSGEEVSAFTDGEGKFLLYGVPSGTYTITVESENESVITLNEVTVDVGTVTTLEPISF